MTAQRPERLTYQGEEMAMCTTPLNEYFTIRGMNPDFKAPHSALWRGYIGSWEIKNGKLYLNGLRGTLDDGTSASLSTIFPNFSDEVLAHWYSGTIRIPRGRELKHIHMGFSSIFEKDLFLEVVGGVVVATRLQRNKVTS